ncbi:uracil-DNA glycosylase [Spirochaetia bacterium]|nr:uracil-DNA glycosylase [Spirochaetia bacterium]
MTADEKLSLAGLLDTAEDYLRDGYRRPRGEYSFTDDAFKENGAFKKNGAFKENGVTPAVAPGSGTTAPVAVSAGSLDTTNLATLTAPDSLETVAAEVLQCTACNLHSGRKNAVPGEGVAHPLVLVIGEGPGADEDRLGRPFVGKAGQLLDKMLASVGLSREKNCFIANMVKCRPPNNRDPLPEEMAPCSRFLARQIRLLKPKLILCVGKVSANALLKTAASIGRLRGNFTPYVVDDAQETGGFTIPLLATYHPSALLHDESYKRPAWEDLKLLKQRLTELDSGYDQE